MLVEGAILFMGHRPSPSRKKHHGLLIYVGCGELANRMGIKNDAVCTTSYQESLFYKFERIQELSGILNQLNLVVFANR